MFHSFWMFACLMVGLWPNPQSPTGPDTALLKAIETKDVNAVALALEAGADVQAHNARGFTPLHVATNTGAIGIMSALLEAGADPDAPTLEGLKGTPLMWATGSDNLAIGELLVKHGATINLADKYGDHALNWAVYQGNLPYTGFLLEHGADPTIVSRHGAALDIAMRRGFEPIMTVIADAIELPEVTAADQALIRAVIDNDLAAVRAGLGDPERAATTDRFGRPLLQLATLKGHQTMVEWFLDRQTPPDASDRIGFTPLMIAARDGNLALAKSLLKAGADINKKSAANSRKLSPLTLAVIGDHEPLISHFLRKGADIDQGDANGNTPLILATAWGRPHLVELLLRRGAKTHLENDEGMTAMDLANRFKLEDIAKMLGGS